MVTELNLKFKVVSTTSGLEGDKVIVQHEFECDNDEGIDAVMTIQFRDQRWLIKGVDLGKDVIVKIQPYSNKEG